MPPISPSSHPFSLRLVTTPLLLFLAFLLLLQHFTCLADAIQPSHPLSPLLPLPSFFPSTRVFCSESALCIRGPKYKSFSFSISPSNEYLGLIFFRIDWFEKKIWIILLTSDLRKNKWGALQHVGENRVSWPHLSGRPVQKVPFQQLPTPPQPPPPRGPTSFLVRSNYSSCDS